MEPQRKATFARELVARLGALCGELLEIRAALSEIHRALADHGVIPMSTPPRVEDRDGRAVTSLKERAIGLHRRQERLLRMLANEGAVIVDRETLELAVPGGPERGSYLSWQPGEPSIAWWRAAPDTASARMPLETGDGAGARPSIH